MLFRMTQALTEQDGPSWREKLPPIPTISLSDRERLAEAGAKAQGDRISTAQQNGTTAKVDRGKRRQWMIPLKNRGYQRCLCFSDSHLAAPAWRRLSGNRLNQKQQETITDEMHNIILQYSWYKAALLIHSTLKTLRKRHAFSISKC